MAGWPITSRPAGSTTRPPSPSRADEALAERFDTGVPNLLLLVTADDGDVDDPAVRAAGHGPHRRAGRRGRRRRRRLVLVGGQRPAAAQRRRHRALVVARIEGNDDQVDDRVAELAPGYERATATPLHDVEVGGFAEVFHEVGDTIEEDLLRAEMIALPITLVLLVLVFGSVVAASLPLVIGVMSIIGTFLVLRVLAGSPTCRSTPSTSRPPWASASPSTTACSSCPATARSCGPATSPGPPWSGPSAPPAARWPSAP